MPSLGRRQPSRTDNAAPAGQTIVLSSETVIVLGRRAGVSASNGEGNGNPLQCSCLENPRDGGAWWAAVYGVAQSRTRLKQLSSSSPRPNEGLCIAAEDEGHPEEVG